MALISCRECGNQVSTEANACPKCGATVSKTKIAIPKIEESKTKWWLWIPLGLVGAFFLIGLSSNSPEAEAKFRAREAIDLCWDEQKRKSLDAQSQRFIASACEKMERDFELKFRHKP